MSADPRANPLEIRRDAIGLSYQKIADEMKSRFNVLTSKQTIRSWLTGKYAPKNDAIWTNIELILFEREGILASQAQKFSTSDQQAVLRETSVYYNSEMDSARGLSLADMGKLAASSITASVTLLSGSSSWSAKSETVKLRLSALLGAASIHIVIGKDYENLRKGSVLSFAPTDIAEPGLYLVFQAAEPGNEDQYLLGIIKPTQSTTIHGIDGDPYSLSDWRPIGYAIAASWGPGDEKRSVRIEMGGIGPMTRI